MFNLGPHELVIILLIVVVLFGGRKIPEILRGLGQGLREFKSASREPSGEHKKLDEAEETTEDTGTEDPSAP